MADEKTTPDVSDKPKTETNPQAEAAPAESKSPQTPETSEETKKGDQEAEAKEAEAQAEPKQDEHKADSQEQASPDDPEAHKASPEANLEGQQAPPAVEDLAKQIDAQFRKADDDLIEITLNKYVVIGLGLLVIILLGYLGYWYFWQ